MHTTTMTLTGQITIPAEIRQALGLVEGDRLEVQLEAGAIYLRRAESVIARTAGIFAHPRELTGGRGAEPPLATSRIHVRPTTRRPGGSAERMADADPTVSQRQEEYAPGRRSALPDGSLCGRS